MNDGDRLVSLTAQPEEMAAEKAIRPQRLSDFVGQAPVKRQMEIFIQAAAGRSEALDHVLIFGPPRPGENHAGEHCRQ